MCKSHTLLTGTLVLAAQLAAGGFWAVLGNPDASTEARSMHAVVTVKLVGCHQPENVKIAGTAIGIVDGRRQSIPLKFTRLSEPGMYALTRQWPGEGKWVIQIVATRDTAVTSTLVGAGPDGVDRSGARQQMRQPTAEEVEAFLRAARRSAAPHNAPEPS